MDLALNNLQRVIYHKTQPTNQPSLNIVYSESYTQDNVLTSLTQWLNVYVPTFILVG